MPYKTKQVQNMLTKAELEMFSQSRRDAIGEHTRKQLDAKITRTRKMRDKYRDLYQRQMVQTQREEPSKRKKFGGENARTLVKADVMNSVLERFEAQRKKLQAKAERKDKSDAEKTRKTSARKTPASKSQGPAMSIQTLKKSVGKALKKIQKQVDGVQAQTATAGHKNDTVVSGRTGATAQGAVPTHMPAKALRKNPLKAQPVNQKIHASQRSRTQAHQAARDGR